LPNSEPSVWLGVLGFNKEAILDAMDRFSGTWADLRLAVQGGDRQGLEAVVARAKAVRRAVGAS